MNKQPFAIAFLSIFIFTTYGVCEITGEDMKSKIGNFSKVDKNLYRGAQPNFEDLKTLKEMGIRKIINFRAEEDLNASERTEVESLGMEYIQIPWTIFGHYKKEVAVKFFDAIADKDTRPVFMHCRRGSERTGVIAALYLMKKEGWNMKQAINYAEEFDLKFIWKRFVKKKLKKYARDLDLL